MASSIDRRQVLTGLGAAGLAMAGVSGPTTSSAALQADAPLGEAAATAASAFLDGLDDTRRSKATYAFADEERTRWHWTTPDRVPRNGLPLREMTHAQAQAALALLAASLSERGYETALEIVSLQEDLGQDPSLYYVTVFGEPGADGPWGWRFEGHHLSRHFTIVGEEVVAVPFFHGAWPTTTEAGRRAMDREENAAREVLLTAEGADRAGLLFRTESLTTHVTQNEVVVGPLDPVGAPLADLDARQRALVDEVVDAYLGSLPLDQAAARRERALGVDSAEVRFGWAGSLVPGEPHYYRLQGPTFLLEFDNSRNSGTHIHSVWRDFEQDFGRHLLGACT